MDTGNIIPKKRTEVSTTTRVDRGAEDRWNKIKQKASRNGTMMLFEAYRMSLGGADNDWGTKIFKQTMIDIGLVETCKGMAGRSGTFCPTTKALDKYGRFFVYDPDSNIWGLSNQNITEFDEVVMPVLVETAIEVRKKQKEARKRRAEARRMEQRKTKIATSLF